MMMPPQPPPPCPFLYSAEEFAPIQEAYEQSLREWRREADRSMWLSAVMALLPCIAIGFLAIMGPDIVINVVKVLCSQPVP